MAVEVRQALGVHFRNQPTITAIVADRIYQPSAPAGSQRPFLVIHPMISRVPDRMVDGTSMVRTRVQVTAVSEFQVPAEQLARAVIESTDGFRGRLGGHLDVLSVVMALDRQVKLTDPDEIKQDIDFIILTKGV